MRTTTSLIILACGEQPPLTMADQTSASSCSPPAPGKQPQIDCVISPPKNYILKGYILATRYITCFQDKTSANKRTRQIFLLKYSLDGGLILGAKKYRTLMKGISSFWVYNHYINCITSTDNLNCKSFFSHLDVQIQNKYMSCS